MVEGWMVEGAKKTWSYKKKRGLGTLTTLFFVINLLLPSTPSTPPPTPLFFLRFS
jgi:hypothetical protein